MKKILPFIIILFFVVPSGAVTVSCVNEGSSIVRIDYDATGENALPKAFALDITVNNGAVIQQIYNYKTGDSTAAAPGFGIFPRALKFDSTGEITDWGSPDVKSGTTGALPGIGTSGVTIEMASRYSGSQNAPPVKGTLCRILVNTGTAQVVNVQVAQNVKAGGVILENAAAALFTGVGCTLDGSTPPPPTAPSAPSSIGYPTSNTTGQYTVEWSASSGAASYRLERSANNGSTWSMVYTGSAISYAENVANGSYRYRVNAQNDIGTSSWMTGSWNCNVSISLPPPPESGIYEAENATLNGVVVANNIAGFIGTGFADYIHASGDYIQWTVNAASAGSYELKIRYALSSGSRPLEIRVNGNIVVSSQSFPATSAWTNWSTVTIKANLNAGANTIRATATGSSGPNIDNLAVTAITPPPPSGETYEAEKASLAGVVVSTAISGYTGTGFADYINPSGDYIEWTVNVQTAGSYILEFRYGLTAGNRPLKLSINGVTVIQSLSFPVTGSWTNWQTVSATQNLNAGNNKIRTTAISSSGPNIDNLKISASTSN